MERKKTKNPFGKLAMCFVALVLAVCPILLFACGVDNTNGKKIEKAMNSSITVLKNGNSTNEDVSAESLEYVEQEEGLTDLFLLDYMKAIAGSEKFDNPSTAFKTIAPVSNGTNSMVVFGKNKYTIDGNNISIECVFTYENSFDNADYECMTINYDFETETLVSFTWSTYVVSEEDTFMQYIFNDGVLKFLVQDESDEYITLKSQTRTKAETLYNTQDVTSKTYNFSQEYVDVYNAYNPEDPIQKA